LAWPGLEDPVVGPSPRRTMREREGGGGQDGRCMHELIFNASDRPPAPSASFVVSGGGPGPDGPRAPSIDLTEATEPCDAR
jgi:hypothetical protein